MIALLAAAALATGLEARTGREPLPARELERPVVLPHGWSALDTTVAWRRGAATWSPSGEPRKGDPGSRRTTLRLDVRHGVGRALELGAAVPWEWGRVGGVSLRSVGDPEVWARLALAEAEPPARSAAVELRHRAPLARVPFGVDGGVWTASAIGRVRHGGLRVEGTLSAERWTAGRLRSVPASEKGGGPYWVKAGDQLRLSTQLLYQAGPIWVAATPAVARRTALRLGRGPAVFPAEDYLPVREPGAWLVDADLSWTAQLTRGAAVTGGVAWPVRGVGTGFRPSEGLDPARGRTWRAGLECRF